MDKTNYFYLSYKYFENYFFISKNNIPTHNSNNNIISFHIESNISKNIKNQPIIKLIQLFHHLISKNTQQQQHFIDHLSIPLSESAHQLTNEEFFFFGCFLSHILFYEHNKNQGDIIQKIKNKFQNILNSLFESIRVESQPPTPSQIQIFLRYFLFSSFLIYFIKDIQTNSNNNFMRELNILKDCFYYLTNQTQLQIQSIHEMFDFIYMEEIYESFSVEFLAEFKTYCKNILLVRSNE